ncbi:TonB-dependent receptor, partial [Pseudoalteromonas phenolica]|uniref:TonB-dependent receptor n=1 Tax=Pseudoalteromonas phenolica TaxID=161398 RepID=UPI00110B50BB
MFKLSPVMLLLSAALPFSAIANQVSGTVLDKNNQPVANAKVSIMGSLKAVETNSKGEFVLSGIKPGKVELHAAASGFAHFNSIYDLTELGLKDIKVSLTPSAIEVIDVVASPFHASNMESATPVSVLSGDALRNQQSATLGDSLAKEVGVHTNFHAGVASTPIIRGLSGPRVLITQNGLDVSDASRVGPDHSVSSEASTAEQIEVLRGPATLFYGSGAIGGVVNVVDKRVPREVEQSGEWLIEHDSVDNQKLASVNINTGSDNIAVHFDGFYRESDDYKVPVKDEHGSNKIANSGEESKGATAGASYILDNGYVGVSVGKLEREYGIPGHSHGDEEVPVFAELEQDRIQLLSELRFTDSLIDSLHTRVAYTDYEHAEIEHGVVGTIFANETVEAKFDALHRDMNGWRGGFSLHYKRSDFSAQGAEAFTPPSETETLAFAWMEERHFDDVLLQLGARVERVTIDAPKVVLPEVELHVHDDHDH